MPGKGPAFFIQNYFLARGSAVDPFLALFGPFFVLKTAKTIDLSCFVRGSAADLFDRSEKHYHTHGADEKRHSNTKWRFNACRRK